MIQSSLFLDRFARSAVTRRLAGLAEGVVELRDGNGAISLGQPADLRATVQVNDPRFYRHALFGGTLSVARSYIDGDWDCDDLAALFRIFARNRGVSSRLDQRLTALACLGHRLFHWWHANTRAGSRRNIAAHYDLGNEFFRLWLDETLAYSCGVFPTAGATLREASLEKFDRICRKLDLRPTDELLEIGAGWGGFAIYAAKHYGCHVTTTTISREQFSFARERIAEEGLSGQITLLQQDYRELRGKFDKLVSIEMIEAVGFQHFDTFFRQCSSLLRDDGRLVLQAIVMPERGYERYLRSVDFIQRYVFPGGCLPSLGAMLDSVARTTDLQMIATEDFSPHYAETLRRWRYRFHDRIADIRRLGYPTEFIRLWHYYLCYCEAAFEERCTGLLQLQFDKPKRRSRLPSIERIAASDSASLQHPTSRVLQFHQ